MSSHEFVAARDEALALLDKIAVFYAQYHILEREERCALALRLKHTRTQWAQCCALEQQHVDLVERLARELRAHFDEWMQDDRHSNKRWRTHPLSQLNALLHQAANTTARMNEALAHNNRRLSAIGSLKALYE